MGSPRNSAATEQRNAKLGVMLGRRRHRAAVAREGVALGSYRGQVGPSRKLHRPKSRTAQRPPELPAIEFPDPAARLQPARRRAVVSDANRGTGALGRSGRAGLRWRFARTDVSR